MMVAAAAVVSAVSILWARSAFHERVFEIDSLSSGERNGWSAFVSDREVISLHWSQWSVPARLLFDLIFSWWRLSAFAVLVSVDRRWSSIVALLLQPRHYPLLSSRSHWRWILVLHERRPIHGSAEDSWSRWFDLWSWYVSNTCSTNYEWWVSPLLLRSDILILLERVILRIATIYEYLPTDTLTC